MGVGGLGQLVVRTRTRRSCCPSTTSACPCERWGLAPCTATRSWRSGRWPGTPSLCSGRTAGKSARRRCAASRHSPGAGDAAAGGNSCGRSGGGQRGWRPAGRSSMPCTHPARHPGTRRDTFATHQRDVLPQHRCCQWLVLEPGTNSALRAVEFLLADAQAEFILLFQVVPRDQLHCPWLELAGWFAVGWLWQEPGTPETLGRRESTENRR